jgi:hypothetical protein
VQELVDLLGAGYTYHGDLRIDSPHGEPPTRVRVIADGERHRAVYEQSDYVYAADYTVPAGPAVVFDPAAARVWLAAPAGDGLSRGLADYAVDPAGVYDPTVHSPADWIERMLRDLAGDPPAAPHVWRTAPGVVVETVGAEGHADGGAVLVVEIGGLRAASRWLTGTDLATADYGEGGRAARPQLDAAVEALGTAADTVKGLVEQHRLVRAADAATQATLCTIPSLTARLNLADVECALRALGTLWADGQLADAGHRAVAGQLAALITDEHPHGHQAGAPAEHPHDYGDYSDTQ